MKSRVLRLAAVLWVLAVTGARGADSSATPSRPIPAIEHVCIISIDGLRPDRALWANTPNLHRLAKEGTYTFWAKTTAVSITLPSHVSMLTGVRPGKHGIEWNRELPFSEPVYPFVPTVFELARKAGYTTAVVAGKGKFSVFAKPGMLTWSAMPATGSWTNDRVLSEAVRIVQEDKPQLLFVHFPETDAIGHAKGWGSPEQLAAIEHVDVLLGQLFSAMEKADVRRSTLIILSADHGGAGLTHGADDPRSRYIPWIANGPGVKVDFDLTQLAQLEVATEDTTATTLFVLGLPIPAYSDGKPVLDAFTRP
ncbi:hypothetical protein DB347_14225 [Opitutaceae bacterium EW11]|nr:hypothetical protein DB347_14225 [Opitutaceae bacterium EW11]